jgi:large subunit ribosomal protein L21
MYAVIRTGGKQYRVAEGDVIRVERLPGEVGGTIELAEVLMLGGDTPKFGAPLVDGAKVSAEILDHDRADKVLIFKKKRRKHYQRTRGHRQHQTVLRIGAISA